ncbi:LETM1-related biofilm-associated protein [Marinirhabdus gelatinilytica]|uniref:LETM1-like protein n=1 Tax=Marinirhabdus gelatinilytica TaxID=1703343 RepID=A0A370QFK8_9FLAO|nr:LETM1-related biofilm-associated protein [Marinirhabdus gelatinilytica]RDK87147.1 LETM1-like protein [Marinirhabdus gelatinilytica]
MNPSANGWIQKFYHLWEHQSPRENPDTEDISYQKIQEIGFIYGASVASLLKEVHISSPLTTFELSKLNLLHLLVNTFCKHFPNKEAKEAIPTILSFYKKIDKNKKGWLEQFSNYKSETSQLERVLATRLQHNNTLLKKNFTSLITYGFLYLDVLAYEKFLTGSKQLKEYIVTIETTLLNYCYAALNSKHKKNKYDRLLLDLFEATPIATQFKTEEKIPSLKVPLSHKERAYILDLCCLAVWDDHTMDQNEEAFLLELCETLQFPTQQLAQSIEALVFLTERNNKKIKLFEYTHPVRQFYKQSANTVKTLILKNRYRLMKELEESGELVMLLSKSTTRDLTKDEKHKVREQILDICKTIPSLTIFLLPGGSLLLPLLIKFIPQLLPSAFHENRIDKK